MQKAVSSFHIIVWHPKPFIAGVRETIADFFDGLPYFQPWAWKMLAAIGAVGFFVGLSIGMWAYHSLEK